MPDPHIRVRFGCHAHPLGCVDAAQDTLGRRLLVPVTVNDDASESESEPIYVW